MQPDISSKHRSSSVKRLISDITEKIHSGELKPGDYLPSANSLAERYGIGYASVIRVYKTLVEAGLVETVQGRGAFVRGERKTSNIDEITVCLPSMQIISSSGNPHSDWVFQKLLAGINAATLARNVRLNLLFAEEAGGQYASVIDNLSNSTGVLFILEARPSWVLRLHRRGIPYALIMPSSSGEWENELPSVQADYYSAVYDATFEMLRKGCKHPAYVGSTSAGHELPRYLGFCQAVHNSGINDNIVVIPCDEISSEAGYNAVNKHFSSGNEASFDLLVAANDLRALGAMKCLSERNIKIPEDVSIIGFDNIPAAAEAGLSTVVLPIREMGEESVRWFFEAVVGNKTGNVPKLTLPCPIIWRTSICR